MTTQRVGWVDSVRGYALFAIMFTHFHQATAELGTRGIFSLTLTQLGWSSAAELFVLCAGFGMAKALERIEARGGIRGGLRWLARRMGLLYIANLLGMLACVAIILLLIPPEHRHGTLFTFAKAFMRDPIGEFLRIAGFVYAPTLFGILNFYLLLLPFIWVLFQIGKRSMLLAGLLSLGVYLLVQTRILPPAASMPAFSFNVWSWQILGLMGIWIAHVEARLPQQFSLWRLAGLLGVFTLAMVVKLLWFQHPAQWEWFAALRLKADLGPLRAAHALLVMFLLREVLLGIAGQTALARLAHDTLGWFGRHSLAVFSVQNVVVYLGAAIVLQTCACGTAYWSVYMLLLLCISTPLLLPLFMTRQLSVTQAAPIEAPVTAEHAHRRDRSDV